MNKPHATRRLALASQMAHSTSGPRVEVRLQHPLVVGDKRIDELTLRAPNAREVQQVLKHHTPSGQLIVMLSLVTALPQTVVERMGVRDFMACSDALTALCNRRAEVFDLVAKDFRASDKN